ncbi:MAG: GmrSD restriction endonuclease domain-containing protein [Pseudonocardiaceae bacterium]
MKASETTVRDVLQGEKQYVVPLYQRRYSWERKDDKDPLNQLWDDVLSLDSSDPASTHFLGSVVLAPSPSNTPAGVVRWLVVDGQQRLTTLSLLLCAIRDHVQHDDSQLAEKIHEHYLVNKYASGDERYRLLPTQEDRQSWIALVERYADAGGEDRIGAAYRFFLRKLQEVDDPEDEHDIRRVEQTITTRLALVAISAHPDDNVHRIFESLNYKGQPLTQADLLRNYLFMRLPHRGDEVYTHQWLPLQKLLSDAELEELVLLDLVLRGDDRATQESIYRSQQLRLDPLKDEHAIERWIAELHHKARMFKRVLDPRTEPTPTLRRALDRLNRWGSATTVHPICLHVMLAHDTGHLNAEDAAAALRVVESYLVRRMIVRLPTNSLGRTMTSLVKDLGEEPPTASAITTALSGPRKRFPTDQHVKDAVLVNYFYQWGRGPQRTFILRALEEDYPNGEPLDFSRATLTIEHVLPQSLTPEWEQILAAGATDGETPEEIHASLVHTLGNLTLTAYNAKLANDSFHAKKKLLANSGLAMNREIAGASGWGRAEIQARGRSLGQRVVSIWPGPDESVNTSPPDPHWALLNQMLASLPTGRWTSYSDVAAVIGSHQVAVGARLATVIVPNAHRVLKLSGHISPDFRWPDPERTDKPREVLEAEGVRFDEWGRADPDQRMTAADLAAAMELDTND